MAYAKKLYMAGYRARQFCPITQEQKIQSSLNLL